MCWVTLLPEDGGPESAPGPSPGQGEGARGSGDPTLGAAYCNGGPAFVLPGGGAAAAAEAGRVRVLGVYRGDTLRPGEPVRGLALLLPFRALLLVLFMLSRRCRLAPNAPPRPFPAPSAARAQAAVRCSVGQGVAVLVGPHPEFTANLLERQWGLAPGGPGGGAGEEERAEAARRGRIAAELRGAEEPRRRFWCACPAAPARESVWGPPPRGGALVAFSSERSALSPRCRLPGAGVSCSGLRGYLSWRQGGGKACWMCCSSAARRSRSKQPQHRSGRKCGRRPAAARRPRAAGGGRPRSSAKGQQPRRRASSTAHRKMRR